ncbi:hypothetical protein PPSIR1_20164, partial [Plesiocystis pacifica SIR-1]
MTTTRTHLTALCLFVLGLAPLAAGCDDDSITDADFRGCSRPQRPLVEDDVDVDEDADAQADNFDLFNSRAPQLTHWCSRETAFAIISGAKLLLN